MANQDFRVKNGLQVGLGASVVGIVTAESFSGSAVGLTSVPSSSLTGTISSERLSGTYDIDILGTVSGETISATTATVTEQLNVGVGDTGVFATATDGTLSVSGIATFKDRVIFDSTNSIQIPVGTDAQKDEVGVAVTGQIRYNTTNSQFEGFGPGNDWGSLGGVKDVDGDTYVKPESSPGSDEDALTFFTAGTERAVIDSNGKVGVGTTNPTKALDVVGYGTANGIRVGDTHFFAFGDGGSANKGSPTFQNLNTNGNTILRVLPNGTGRAQFEFFATDYFANAGIGTTTWNNLRIFADNNQGEIRIDTSAATEAGVAKSISIETNVEPGGGTRPNQYQLYLDVNGNIGLGTNTPSANLDVVGTQNVSGISTFQDRVIFDSTNSIQIPVGTSTERDSVGTAVTGQIRYNTTLSSFEGYGPGGEWGTLGGVKDIDQDTYITAQKDLSVDDDALRFYTNGTEQVSIDSTGKVGIGSTQPTSILDLDGTLNVSGISTFQGNVNLLDDVELTFGNNPDLKIYHDGGNASYIRDVGTGNLNIDSIGGNIQIRVNGSESAIIAKQSNAVELYYDAVKKFETTTDGFKVLNGTSETAVISGPQNIIFDPSPDDVVAITTGAISAAGVSTITGITTTNIAVGNLIQEVDGIISTGTTVTSVGVSQVGISKTSLGSTTNQEFTFANQTPTGIVRIKGDLYIDGTRTEINSTTLTVDDLNVVVASGATNGLTADTAGLTVDGANAYLKYNYNAGTNETWELNKNVGIGTDNATAKLDVDGTLNVSGISTFSDDLIVGTATTGVVARTDGTLNVSGVATFQSTVNLGDNDRLNFYTTNTTIYGNANGLNIEAAANNDVLIKSNSSGGNSGDIKLRTVEGGRIDLTGTGGVGIYHTDTAKKLETVDTGISVYGNIDLLTSNMHTTGTSTISGPATINIDPASPGYTTGGAFVSNGVPRLGTIGIGTDIITNIITSSHVSIGDIVQNQYVPSGTTVTSIDTVANEIGISNITTNTSVESNETFDFGYFTVGGTVRIRGDFDVDGTLNVSGVSTFQDDVNIGTGSTVAFFDISEGKVGIGSTAPTATLDINGTLNVSGVSTFHDDIWIPDNKIIWHTAAASGGGPVRAILNDTQTDWLYREYLKTTAGVGKSTYVSTSSSGVDYEISLGNADNFYIGSNGIIPFNDYPTGNISFEVAINGATSLYYNHIKKLETTIPGVSVTGGLNVSGIATARSFVGSGELLTNLDAYAAYTSDRSTLATIADKISGIATYSEDQGFNYLGGNESFHTNSFFYGVDIEASDDGKVMFVSSIPITNGDQAGCGVQIYERTNSNFNYVGFVTSLSHHTLGAGQTVGDLGTWFGPTLASNADASIFAVGSPNSVSRYSGDNQYGWWDSMSNWEGRHGCVNIFQKTGNNIEPLGILTAPDIKSSDASQFGQALAFSSDGTKLYVSAVGIETTAYGLLPNGSSQHGLVYAYNKVGTSYQQVGVLTSYRPNPITFPNTWGHRVVCSDDGDTIFISGPSENPTNGFDREGLVEVYSRTGNTFTHVGILTCGHDPNVDTIWNDADFGISMDCSSDGNIIAIAANPSFVSNQTPQGGYGALFVFEKTGTNTFSKIVEEIFDTNTVGTNNTLEIGKYDLRVNSDASVIVMSASEVTGASGSDPGGYFVAFSRDGGNISKIGAFTPLTPQPSGATFDFMMFGNSLAIDSTGDNIFVGAPVHPLGNTTNSLADKGSAYVFNITRQIALHSNQITGNIGIGTDNPTSSLDINGTLNVSGISTFQNDVNIGIGGTTAFFDISEGKVGIGSTQPTAKLDVNGTLNVSGITTIGSPVAATGITTNFKVQDGNAYWAVEFAGSGNARGPYVASNGGSGGMYLSGDSDFAFTNYAGNELYLQFERSSGRVRLSQGTGANYSTRLSTTEYGIDVTGRVETDTLNVSGIATIGNYLNIGGSDISIGSTTINGDQAITFDGTAGNLFTITDNLTTGNLFAVNDVSGFSVFEVDVDGTTRMGLATNDNVGIGSAQPTAKLDVNGTLNVSGVSTFQDDVNIGTGSTVAFFDISAGRVGIGSTTPTAKLDVNGTLNVSGISTFENNVHLLNNDHLYFGTNDDIDIYSNGSNGIVTSTVNLHVRTPHLNLMDNASGNIAVFDDSNGVYLFNNNSKKFETTGYGVTVIGSLNVSGIATAQKFVGDGSELTNLPPAGSDLVTYASASNIANSAESISGISSYIQIDSLLSSQTAGAARPWNFGNDNAMSADASTLIVGAPKGILNGIFDNIGVVHVFDREGNSYREVGILTASEYAGDFDHFGYSVACSNDGRRIVVGAWGDEPLGSTGAAGGLVHIFDRQGDTFTRVGVLTGSYASQSGDSFGYSVDCSGDGNVIVVGAKFDETGASLTTGVVYVFDRSGNNFTEVGIITSSSNAASDALGHSVSISDDGNTIVASAIGDGSNNEGIVYVFDRVGVNTFTQVGILTGFPYADDSSEFGTQVKISSNGKTIAVGCPNAEVDEAVDATGLVHVFDRNPDNTFTRVGVLTGSHASGDDEFGYSIDVSADGNTIAVGAYYDELTGGNSIYDNDGLGYIFTRQGDTFEEVSTFILGRVPTLSADGKTVAFGDPSYESGGDGAGRVVIYEQQRQTYLHSTSTGNIGIGVTNPTAKLDVDGSIAIKNHSIVSITTSHTASAGTPFTIDTFATSENDLAEYTIHVGYGNTIQAQKVLVMHDGVDAYSQEYAIMHNPSKIVSIEASISGGNVLLQATPETGISGITTYKIVRGGLV